MANDRQQAREEMQSLFPAKEGPSFCSRPTPVVPANPDLCDEEQVDLESRQSVPTARLSDRPTFVPDDYVEPRLESSPTVTIGDPTPIDAPIEEASSPENRPVPPPLPKGSAPAELSAAAGAAAPLHSAARPRRSGRTHFARFLFVVLFGSVGVLLSYAFKPRLEGAIEQLRAGAAPAGEHAK